MGGVVSTSLAKAFNSLTQQMTESCTNTQEVNQVQTCRVIANGCSHVRSDCENKAVLKQYCSLQQTSSLAQTAITQSISTASSGAWGIAVSNSTAISENLVDNTLTQACANTVIANQTISSISEAVCNNTTDFTVNFLNDFTASQICYAAQTSKVAQQAAASATSTAQGYDPAAIFIIVCVCGTVIVLGLLAPGIALCAPPKSSGGKTAIQTGAAK